MGLLSKLMGVIPNKTPVSTEESLWALAMSEFNGLNRRPGLWAQSLAGANGDESKAQAAYLKARYDELAGELALTQALESARAQTLADQERARAKEMAEVRAQSEAHARAQREARAKAAAWVHAKSPRQSETQWLYPTADHSNGGFNNSKDANNDGLCPGCNRVIPLESSECPCCGLLFDGSPGSLRITPI